jgi:hypothetical protein
VALEIGVIRAVRRLVWSTEATAALVAPGCGTPLVWPETATARKTNPQPRKRDRDNGQICRPALQDANLGMVSAVRASRLKGENPKRGNSCPPNSNGRIRADKSVRAPSCGSWEVVLHVAPALRLGTALRSGTLASAANISGEQWESEVPPEPWNSAPALRLDIPDCGWSPAAAPSGCRCVMAPELAANASSPLRSGGLWKE